MPFIKESNELIDPDNDNFQFIIRLRLFLDARQECFRHTGLSAIRVYILSAYFTTLNGEIMSNKSIKHSGKLARWRKISIKLNCKGIPQTYYSIMLFLLIDFLIFLPSISAYNNSNHEHNNKTESHGVDKGKCVSCTSYNFSEHQSFECLNGYSTGYGRPFWSPQDDPNYENGLEKLIKASNFKSIKSEGLWNFTESTSSKKKKKPSFLFSLPDMKKLVLNEIQIYSAMKSYLLEVEPLVEKVKRWVKDYEDSTLKAALQADDSNHEAPDSDPLTKLVTNPIVTHRMVRRFAKDLDPILELLPTESHAEEKFVNVMSQVTAQMEFPDIAEDYQDSLESILRIQHYTNYSTQDVKDGKLGTLQSNISLTCSDAFDLAVQAFFPPGNADSSEQNAFIRTLGIEWMEMALKLYEDEAIKDDQLKEKITYFLKGFVKHHDETWATNRNLFNEWYFDDLIGSDFGSHLPQRPRYRRDFKAIAHRNETEYSIHTESNFRTLCSGINLQTEAEKAQLTCWYDSSTHPYWTIQPIKKEALSLNPELYQMYDILSPGTIKYIIEKATPEMRRSVVVNKTDPTKNVKHKARTSNQAWLYDLVERFYLYNKSAGNILIVYPDAKLTAVDKRIEYSSGLNVLDVRASEANQVTSYGASHHVEEHVDPVPKSQLTEERGDRIATYIFYLTDVEVGGITAFPVIGTAANPVAGSAIMWYNLKKNGDIDYRTFHGGCPVVYGQKWSKPCNKWMLTHGNWNKRPCSLISTE